MQTHAYRFPFTPFPDGVYAVAFSHEVKLAQVVSILVMGEKIALFRSEDGVVGAVESYCPHLGADLSDGIVKNASLQCPFHGLRFNRNGICLTKNHLGVAGTYQVKHWEVFEQYGLIFLVYNPLNKRLDIQLPAWELAEWGEPVEHCFRIKSHPQEILENSVDQLHFYQVHQYMRVINIEPIKINGSEFSIRYHIERREGLFGFLERSKIEFFLDIHAYGLGMSKVEITLPRYQLNAVQIVFPTPIDGDYVHVRSLTSVKIPDKIPSLVPRLVKKSVANYLSRIAAKGFLKDFMPDLAIWEKKRYVAKPDYLAGDGDFVTYRKWAEQFYRLKEHESAPDTFACSVQE